jgi:hypothetical protein
MRIVHELTGWSSGDDGFTSPAGTITSRRAGSAPVPPHRVVANVCARMPELGQPRTITYASILTDEAEHAWLASVDLGAARLEVGVVLVEEDYLIVTGIGYQADEFARLAAGVRTLVATARVELGIRPRRFEYTPPAGWHGIARDLMTEWYPFEFPRRRAMLTVFPAMLIVAPAESAIDRLLEDDQAAGFALKAISGPCVSVMSTLTGLAWTIRGQFGTAPACVRDLMILRDDVYQYSLIMERTPEDEQAYDELTRVMRSIVPLPRPAPDGNPLAYWAE